MTEIRTIRMKRLDKLNDKYAGKFFGKLMISEIIGTKKSRTVVKALCECGNSKEFFLYNILRGTTKSCGCILKGFMISKNKHGEATRDIQTIEWKAWSQMKTRVLSRSISVRNKHSNFDKLGISICCIWLDKKEGYNNFLKEMGRKPTKEHRLYRIDKTKGFNIENCKWLICNNK